LTHVSTPKRRKKLRSKTLIYGLKKVLETKKTKIDYTNKANANHIKTIEIKFVLWLAPLLPPKEVAKVVTSNGGKGKRQRQKPL
jgi:hypothetical protein